MTFAPFGSPCWQFGAATLAILRQHKRPCCRAYHTMQCGIYLSTLENT